MDRPRAIWMSLQFVKINKIKECKFQAEHFTRLLCPQLSGKLGKSDINFIVGNGTAVRDYSALREMKLFSGNRVYRGVC